MWSKVWFPSHAENVCSECVLVTHIDKSIHHIACVWYLTLGLAAITLSTGSQREDDFMQSTSTGENSCSLLSKTVRLSILLTEGIRARCPILSPPTPPSLTLWLISSHLCARHVMLVLFVCAGKSIPHNTVQRKGRKKTFLYAEEKSLREDYASPDNDIIKSGQKKRKGGCKKDGIETGW